MSYSIQILRRAQKELAQLPQSDYERVKEAVKNLSQNPRPQDCRKLIGREGWRIRVGDYRVIYEIDDAQNQLTVYTSATGAMSTNNSSIAMPSI